MRGQGDEPDAIDLPPWPSARAEAQREDPPQQAAAVPDAQRSGDGSGRSQQERQLQALAEILERIERSILSMRLMMERMI
jgi:hypothetical protein